MKEFPIGARLTTALSGSMRDFRALPGADLLERVNSFHQWQEARREFSLWPLGRSTESGPRTRCMARDDSGVPMTGVNFASQDYLGLSAHPAINAAAMAAIEQYGVHSAGSPALVGNTSVSLELERRIADFLGMEEVILFPTGWAAGFGIIKGLVRPSDHIVMDALSHACLQEGAQAATRNISLFRHNDMASARAKLEQIRSTDRDGGILVVTESLFSMDSDTPDLAALQALAREFNATLVVDVAHDLGCLGPGGRGHIAAQGMLGKIDVVMGSFSKTFASNGGFVAVKTRAVKEYLRYYSSPCTFSNALSPVQAAVVLKAFEIVESEEGASLRAALMENIDRLRGLLTLAGFELYGQASAIVAVKMGTEGLARMVARLLPGAGLIANLVEYPAVPKGQARFRMQVMANHGQRDIVDAVQRLTSAFAQASEQYDAFISGRFDDAAMEEFVRHAADEPAAEAAGAARSLPLQSQADSPLPRLKAS